jgi:ankyrin repeat protein
VENEPPLLFAARHDAYSHLDQLLESGENPNQTNKAGETPLILAVQRGFEKAVYRLLQAGADALQAGGDITTSVRTNALYFSMENGNYNIVKMLLDSIELNTYDKIVWYHSVGNRYMSFCDKCLLEVENLTSWQPTPLEALPSLFQAIYKDDLAAFKKLLAEGANALEVLSNGLTPLHAAIRFHRDAMFDLLIDSRVDINQRNSPCNYSPLFVAVHVQNKHAYQRLIELGAEDLPTGHLHTALFAAVYSNDMPVVQELIARGSNINQYAQSVYCTLVFCAVRYGHIDMLKYLLSLGLHPDAGTEGSNAYSELFYGSQFTALTTAVKNGAVEAVELLLKAGADPNRKSNGIPPLHFAAPSFRFAESETIDYPAIVNRYIAIIDLLLAYGADINLKADHNHITCLIKAIVTDQEEIAMHLVKSGALCDRKDKRGKLPLDYARSFNQSRLVSCL